MKYLLDLSRNSYNDRRRHTILKLVEILATELI